MKFLIAVQYLLHVSSAAVFWFCLFMTFHSRTKKELKINILILIGTAAFSILMAAPNIERGVVDVLFLPLVLLFNW